MLRRVLLIVVGCGILAIICAIALYLRCAQDSKLIPYEALASERSNIAMAEIHYLSWGIMSEIQSPPITEARLISGASDFKVVGGPGFAARIHMLDLLNDFPFERDPDGRGEVLYCCSLYTWDNKVFRISLARTDTVLLLINGEAYKATPKVVEALIKLLPFVEYSLVHDELDKVGFWSNETVSDTVF